MAFFPKAEIASVLSNVETHLLCGNSLLAISIKPLLAALSKDQLHLVLFRIEEDLAQEAFVLLRIK